jgi:serine/threonine-protein kinase
VTGQTILHYEVREVLGEGSMGVVYKALDRKLDRLVALKFLPAHLAAVPERVERFLQEATALSVVNHPHIATIYDIEQLGQQRFLVLEYLSGGTLKARLDPAQQGGQLLPIDSVVEYGLQVAEGLAHAHRRGIVHRDIKASNLLLTDEGRVKITDFGVAKLSRASGRTTPGSLIGTIRYMSPEQAQGMEADARSDIFSFGVVLFELASARLPFEAENDAALLVKIVSSPAPPLRAVRPDVPEALERIVSRALMKRPEGRYQSATEIADELRRLRDSPPQPTLSEATRRSSTISEPASARRRAIPIAGVLFAFLAFVAAAVYIKAPASPQWLRFARLPAEKRLAVLPFRNTGGDSEGDAFCAGLFEILGNRLSRLERSQKGLRVISTSEILREGVASAREARGAFGATLALTGSLLRSSDKVIVVSQLVDTKTQLALDSRKVEMPSTELPQLQDRLVEQVAGMLRLNVPPASGDAALGELTVKPAAYEAFLQGLGYLQRYDRADNVSKALESFERAVALDPQFALAYAGRAEAQLRRYQVTRDEKLLKEARGNCERAMELNNQLSAIHVTMGLIHNAEGKYQDAIISFESALKLQPNNGEIFRELANAYAAAGRLDNAEMTYRRAIQLRPEDWTGYKDLGVFLNQRGRLREAVPYFNRVVELTPDNYSGYANLGGLFLRMGDYSAARSMLEKSVALHASDQAYSNLGTLYYFQERYREAAEMYQKAVELAPVEATYWGNVGDAYRWVPGKQAESETAFRRAIQLTQNELERNENDSHRRANLSRYLSAVGERERALAELARALELSPADPFVLSRAALVYEQSGMREAALAAVEDALREGFSVAELQRWPPLAGLRKDPRYQQLIDNRALDPPTSKLVPR